MTLRAILLVALALFPASELALAAFRRAKAHKASIQDAGSYRALWLLITAGSFAAAALAPAGIARFPFSASARAVVALALIVAGMTIRWAAIFSLGRLFTVNVAIHPDHRLVVAGPYRFVRHPSYTGLIVAFLGVGVSFGNALSLVALMVPTVFAVWNRIGKEEAALASAFGESYADYAARTKRLIPGVV